MILQVCLAAFRRLNRLKKSTYDLNHNLLPWGNGVAKGVDTMIQKNEAAIKHIVCGKKLFKNLGTQLFIIFRALLFWLFNIVYVLFCKTKGTNPKGTSPKSTNPKRANPKGANPKGANPKGTNPKGATQKQKTQGANPRVGTTPRSIWRVIALTCLCFFLALGTASVNDAPTDGGHEADDQNDNSHSQ